MKNYLKAQLPSPSGSRRKEYGQSPSRRNWHGAHLAQKGTSCLSAHVLYFQRQPGSSSLLEAVAWPKAARRGPPVLLESLGVGSIALQFMTQGDLKGTPSIFFVCFPGLGHIAL